MCECIKKVTETVLKSMTDQSTAKKETVQEVKTWDGEGLRGKTFALGKGNSISQEVMKTDFIFRTTFTKKDGTTSRPKSNHCTIIFTFCPFCGEKYKLE